MANDIIVSEMTSASQINTNDLMIMTQPDLLAETGYSTKKGTVLQVANKMLKGTEYLTDLPDFTDKTVLGGLEELKGDLTALLPVNTASGAIANFDTDLTLPLVDCKANIVASQASGTPTPSTPLPITGYSSANITRCGVNLVNIEGRTITSQTTVSANFIIKKGTYAFSADMTNNNAIEGRLRIVKVSNPNIYVANLAIEGNATSRKTNTFTLTEDTLCYAVANGASAGYNFLFDNVQLELGSTPSAYHAYNEQTYAIAFGQTVYGGVLDVTNGKLTVTHANIASYNGESINEPWLSSMDTYVPNTTPTTGAQVVYPLTTPFDIDLTPVQINALLGVNNIYNDTNGDTEVKYKEGIQHYIDKKIAATQALIL